MFRQFTIFFVIIMLLCATNLIAQVPDILLTRIYSVMDLDEFYLTQYSNNEGYDFVNFTVSKNNEKIEMKPPLSSRRITREFLAGFGGCFLIGLGGAVIGDILWAPFADPEVLGDLRGAIYGFIISFPIGSAIGVYVVGDTDDETGSFGTTLGGSLFGGAMGLVVAFGAKRLLDFPYLGYLIFAGSSIGATIGFNSSRRYKTLHSSETGLINFRDGQVCLTVPTVYLSSHPFYKKTLFHNVDLVIIEF